MIGRRRSGFVGDERRSLFDFGNRRSGLWVMRGDSCLVVGNRRSGFWVVGRSLFDVEIWAIGF
ncbi:hypothetical protein H6F44_04870 [Pseudanabaena sp. FACHB-1277]|uniref:Uncharacterized protein n=1 Tax=Pseudanabaena cinerea FACHB-1277 TaxID=2949581 RepID=A0A926URK0_9CYAN|nr:hypothetical protein [Pseudanabaena cinerea]MBD2149461.1 hypothetical protein [Pseudanabaena cinerea FACHB-1277]